LDDAINRPSLANLKILMTRSQVFRIADRFQAEKEANHVGDSPSSSHVYY